MKDASYQSIGELIDFAIEQLKDKTAETILSAQKEI
jgi:hypothetical protein